MFGFNKKKKKEVADRKIEKRRQKLQKLNDENIQNLAELKKGNVKEVKEYFNETIRMFKMSRFSYDTDEENKDERGVRSRTIKLYCKRVVMIFFAALLFNFGIISFLNRGDTIPSGVSGIPMLIVLVMKNNGRPEMEKYFALMFFAVNIPFFAILGPKEKRSFILLTILFMVFQIVINFILSSIPEVTDFIYRTINVAPGYYKQINILDANGQLIEQFENQTSWPILVNGFLGSLCVGSGIALTWKYGASTGGTDLVSYYYSVKKQKSVGNTILVINGIASAMYLVIFGFLAKHKRSIDLSSIDGQYIMGAVAENANKGILDLKLNIDATKFSELISAQQVKVADRTVLGMRELSAFLYLINNCFLLNLLYPKYKKVCIEISCKDPNKFIEYFKDVKYWHAYTIFKGKSGFDGSATYIIQSTLLLLETKNLVSDLKIIDKNAWIAIKPVDSVEGSFNAMFVEQ